MAKQIVAILLLTMLLLTMLPGLAHAQEPEPRPIRPPELDEPIPWDGIPDRFGYVSWTIQTPVWQCEPEPEYTGWVDPGYPFRWLGWKIRGIIQDLWCFLAQVAQFFANIFAMLLNAVIAALNMLNRLFIYIWLWARRWTWLWWWFVELLRWLWREIYGWLIWCWVWLNALALLFFDVIMLIVDVVMIIGMIIGGLLGLIGWIGGLLLGFLLEILASLSGTSAPPQLTGAHPIYRVTRGILEGFRASTLGGWIMILTWGMIYIGAVWWAQRFLSSKAHPTT